jgi:hypothetical protein
VHFHAFGIALRLPVAAGVAIIADQFPPPSQKVAWPLPRASLPCLRPA